MWCRAAVRVDDDFASRDACLAVWTADNEPAGRVDINFRVVVHQAGWHDAIDDLLDNVAAPLIVRDVFAMLTRDDDRIDADRLAPFVLDGDLRFAVRTQIVEHAVTARAREPFDELVRE